MLLFSYFYLNRDWNFRGQNFAAGIFVAILFAERIFSPNGNFAERKFRRTDFSPKEFFADRKFPRTRIFAIGAFAQLKFRRNLQRLSSCLKAFH